MQLWDNASFPENAPPDVDTLTANSATKYSATLRGNANENGLNSTIAFEYAKDSTFTGSTTVVPGANSINGSTDTGGDTEADTFFSVGTGSVLDCGTQYFYRIRTNSGSFALGDTVTFTTDACNVGPTITWTPPPNLEEDVPFNDQVDVTDSDDSLAGISFSLMNQPAGMTIDQDGNLSWTPPNGVLSTGSFTITVADGGEDDATPPAIARPTTFP